MLQNFEAAFDHQPDFDFEMPNCGQVGPAGEFEFATLGEPDWVLIRTVAQSLRASGYPAFRMLNIYATGNRIVLSGRVPTYHQKQLAQSIVQRLQQVRGIVNNIEVVNQS